MSEPKRVEALEAFASGVVGDSTPPRLYFVTDQGVVVTVTRSYSRAHNEWYALAGRRPRIECALEDRHTGCICSVEPESDLLGAKLICIDDSSMLPQRVRAV